MLITSNRPSMVPLNSSSSSPDSHDDDQLPADLSPRSSNSSLMSSNESLLNTSPSMPSPGMRESVISPRESAGQGEVSPLQCLQNAFSNRRSPFSLYHDADNEHLEHQIKYGLLESPVARDSSPAMQCYSEDEMHPMARTPSGSPTSSSNGINLNSVASTIFQCPLCAVISNSRHDFNEHLVTHSQQHACPRCSFITGTEDELRDHVQETHGDDYMEMLSDDEAKTPKTNAQGKLKTFKCKHCEHRAVTKKEFWDHTKSHIRTDKMLHCPKCPFITEYKHHLEYHLRNHMGSKPYQCTKCPYSCVNKSMLNSHLKSHSNVYQYRCDDCSYATKYCHSLKLHLRKYNHKPAMVLNPDGTPNPLPIIDVYGTRRGPKMKRPDPILEGLATTTPAIPYSPNGIINNNNNKPAKTTKKGMSTPVRKEKVAKPRQQHNEPRDLSPKLASSPRYVSSLPSHVVTPPLKRMKEESSGDSDSDIRLQSYFQSGGRRTQLPQAPISPTSIALILQQTNNGMGEQQPRKESSSFPLSSPNALQQIYSAAVNQYLMNPALNGGASLSNLAMQMEMTNDQQTKLLAQILQSRALYEQHHQLQQQQHLANDLRVSNHELGNDIPIAPNCALDLSSAQKNDDSMANNEETKRRKRKGKASRYERRCSSDDDEDEAIDFSYNNNNNENKEIKKRRHESPTDLSIPTNNLLCKYCEISFPDREMYAIHMNFHSGDVEPFLCRSCGKKTRDKVEFSRHLFTDPH